MAVVTVAGSEMIMLQQRGEVITTGTISIADNSVTSAKIVDGAILNADLNTSAGIEFSKMENLTASKLLVSDSNGDVSASSVTTTNLTDLTDAGETALHSHAGGGATARVGGDTSEGTTTSTSLVELLALTGLSITAATPLKSILNWRKVSGEQNAADYFLQINSTNIGRIFVTVVGNTTGDGMIHTILPASLSNYQKGGSSLSNDGPAGTGHHLPFGETLDNPVPNRPTANVTDYDLLALTTDTRVYAAADEMHVYTTATS
jgi:hypothetical protein